MTTAAESCRRLVLAALLLQAAACSGQGEQPPAATDVGLQFSVPEGRSQNHFIQQDGIAAHLNLQTSPRPRLIVAFPAGNSGAALFFHPADAETVWGAVTNLHTVMREDMQGRSLYGIQADIDVEAGSLALDEADVGSVRFLRKAVDYSALPTRGMPDRRIDGNRVRFSRERADGQPGYLMEVEILEGELQTKDGLRFAAVDDGALTLRVTAASGDPLEAPVAAARLLSDDAADNEVLENSLAFLTYQSKMLAGSWRFLTYFGRDTLLSVRLLMPVLTPEAAEIGFGSVLERVNEQGEVAHEEDIGELAVFRNMAERGRATAEPVYDYKMIDDNLMLAPVLDNYMATFGVERTKRFLAGHTSTAEPFSAQLARNLRLVVRQAAAFASEPVVSNLVAIKDGSKVGNWRDSQEGLAGGRYPYDVNAVLMPAALRAAANIIGTGVLEGYADSLPVVDELRRMAAMWETHAADFFRVSVGARQAGERLVTYAAENGYPLAELPDGDLGFYALALDAAFQPIPVMHSDIGTDLLFLERPENELLDIVSTLARPFPAGLSTAVGVLSANPAFADAEIRAMVTQNHYHGTVVWSWQQAMIVAGLDRQLQRNDLSTAMRDELQTVRQDVWQHIMSSKQILGSELWSFEVLGDQFVIAPFGQSTGHLTESNAVQLWSTVFLAL